MTKTPVALFLAGLILLSIQIQQSISASYHFELRYLKTWHLADKSSTIAAKQTLIVEFVDSLEKGRRDFASHDATFLQTPNNSFDENLKALKTLRDRLSEIQKMNPLSFEYNTAIQQITAQEQGEARALIHVLRGCFERESFPFVWGWIGGVATLSAILLVIIGGAMMFHYYDP